MQKCNPRDERAVQRAAGALSRKPAAGGGSHRGALGA